jgi:hypothetical protein
MNHYTIKTWDEFELVAQNEIFCDELELKFAILMLEIKGFTVEGFAQIY